MSDDKAGGLKDEVVATLKKQTSPEISSLAARVMGGYQPDRSEILRLAASCLSQDEGGRRHTPKPPLIEEARAARAEIIQNPTARFDLPDDDGA